MSTRLPSITSLCAAALLAACSQGGNAPAPAPAAKPATASAAGAATPADANAAADAKADHDFKLYDQMRISESYDLAAQLGADLVAKYPQSAAAAKVKETLADVQAKAKAQSETRRLAALWAYTAVPEKGGMQYAGSIESSPPLTPPGAGGKDARHVHLIIRQHPQWGQNVYLILDNDKFDCRNGCPTLPVSFDGEPAKPMKATIPPTGEPALFIDDDRTFINRALHTRRVAIDVVLKGEGKKTLVFETGGLDMSHLPGAAKKK